MRYKLQISIPTPCQENWRDMSLADKGRFCASCQKHVIDFTNASDRQIAEVFKKEGNVCGRFLKSQLERDLVIPKEKSSLWMAASAAVITFLGLGHVNVFAQSKHPIVQDSKKFETKEVVSIAPGVIAGTVMSQDSVSLPNATVTNKITGKSVTTDIYGNFKIVASVGDKLAIRSYDYADKIISVDKDVELIIVMTSAETQRVSYMLGGAQAVGIQIVSIKRSFVGSVFYSIGNIFHKRDN
jgi:hypothetical protein